MLLNIYNNMKIAFLDFWYGFDSNNNFLIHLFKEVNNDIIVSNPHNADIIVFSCFGNEHIKYNKKKIFFTGENKRPDYNTCDYSISFDFDDYNGKNIRIPLWYYYIDWFNKGSYNNPNYLIPVDYLDKPNIYNKTEKTKFCTAVFSRPEKSRIDMINLLNSYKKVDCYGSPHVLKLKDGEQYKLDVISNYKFSVCFENSIYNGYYTEKLLHAKIVGNIPIYYADKNISKDFNDKSFLNLSNYSNMNELFEHIKEIDNNETLYSEIINQKLFHKIGIEEIKEKLKKII